MIRSCYSMLVGAILSSIIVGPRSLCAQELYINRIEYAANKVVIHYDLPDSVVGRYFTIRAYSSIDNFLNPLVKISGDAGLEIRPGLNKKIIWDAQTELGQLFSGKVSIEIRARVFVPFVRLGGFEEYRKIVRGRYYNLTWTGGTPQNILNLDLYDNSTKIVSFPNIANVGHYKLKFPVYVKPRKDYRLRISDSKNQDEVVLSVPFEVKRKIPLLLKTVSALSLIAAVTHFLNGGDEDEGLPGPIKPGK